MTLGHPYPGQTDPDPCCTCAGGVKIVATGKWVWAELEITAGYRTFSDQNGKTADQVPICLDMNSIGFLLCPSKSYHMLGQNVRLNLNPYF